MTRQPNELKKRTGAELRALAEQRAAAVGDPAAEARARESSFLSNLSKAQTDFEWIAEHEAWTLLGHDSLADWWAAKVAPVMSALSMRLTPEMATKVIEKVKAAEAHLPASQRHSARDLAALVGTSDWTARGRQDRDKRRGADHPDLENPAIDPLAQIPAAEQAVAEFLNTQTDPEPTVSDSDPAGSAAGVDVADPSTPAATPSHPDAIPGDEDGSAKPSDAQPPAASQGPAAGDEVGSGSSSQGPGQTDGRERPEVPGVSAPAALDPEKVRRNEALTSWAQDTPEHRTSARRRQYFAFLEAGEKFMAAIGPDELAGEISDEEFGDGEAFSDAFVTWLTAVDAIRKQSSRLRLVKGA